MSDERLEKILRRLQGLLLSAAIGAAVCALITMLCSCRTVKYVPVEHTTYRTINRTDTVRAVDSVIMRDTVSYTTRGDTVVKTQIKWRTVVRNAYKVKMDTVWLKDTVTVRRMGSVGTVGSMGKVGILGRLGTVGKICGAVGLLCLIGLTGYRIYRKFK